MTHTTEGTLVAYLDGEVTAAERTEIEGHLAVCDACEAEVRLLSGLAADLSGALAALDVPAPVERAHREILANREAPARVEVLRLRRLGARSLAKAAGLALLLAGAASAAIPGSPVRRWVADAWDRMSGALGGGGQVVEAPAPAAPPVVADEAPMYGAGVEPVDGAVLVVLREARPGTLIRVRIVDDESAMIHSSGGLSPRYTRRPGVIEARGLGEQITVEIPRSARSARVELDGRTLLTKVGTAVRAEAPLESAAADEFVFRSGT